MTAAQAIAPSGKYKNIGSWVLQAVLAFVFLGAGVAKIMGVPMLVDIFQQIGLGQWFRYFTAIVEIAGAITLLIPGYAALAASWLAITMLFATIAHVTILKTSPGAAITLCILSLVVVALRKSQLSAILGRAA